MSKLSLVLFALCASSVESSVANEVEVFKPALPTKEALILPKNFLKNLKFAFPFSPLLRKDSGPFGPKSIPPSEKHPILLGPLGILNKKSIAPVDTKLSGSGRQHVPKYPHIPDDPKFVDDRKNKHLLGLKPFHPLDFSSDAPLPLKPFLSEHSVLVPEVSGPKPIKPALSTPFSPPLVPKMLHDHSLHSVLKIPLFEPETLLGAKHIRPLKSHIFGDPKFVEHRKHPDPLGLKPRHSDADGLLRLKPFLPKHRGLVPEVAGLLEPKPHGLASSFLEPKLLHDSSHSIPKKTLLVPEAHLEGHLLNKKEKHIHPLSPHIFGDPNFVDDRKQPHHLGLKPIRPLHSDTDGLPRLEPFFPEHRVLPSLEPKLLHDHSIHPLPKKPLFVPEKLPVKGFLNKKEKKTPPLISNIFGDPKFLDDRKHPHPLGLRPIHPLNSDADGPPRLKPFLPEHRALVPEVAGPLESKRIGPTLSEAAPSLLEPKLIHDNPLHPIVKKPLFVPEPHKENNQEKSRTIINSDSSISKFIPVYEPGEEVESFENN